MFCFYIIEPCYFLMTARKGLDPAGLAGGEALDKLEQGNVIRKHFMRKESMFIKWKNKKICNFLLF